MCVWRVCLCCCCNTVRLFESFNRCPYFYHLSGQAEWLEKKDEELLIVAVVSGEKWQNVPGSSSRSEEAKKLTSLFRNESNIKMMKSWPQEKRRRRRWWRMHIFLRTLFLFEVEKGTNEENSSEARTERYYISIDWGTHYNCVNDQLGKGMCERQFFFKGYYQFVILIMPGHICIRIFWIIAPFFVLYAM